MSKLHFNLSKKVRFGSTDVFVDEAMKEEKEYAGLVFEAKNSLKRKVKNLLFPLLRMRNFLLVDGFIEVEAGKLIKKYAKKDSIFLDIGCGDLRLKKYLPKGLVYNGFDITLSQVYLNRALKGGEEINLALASAKKIPLADNSISLVASTEVFEHITGFVEVIKEVYRVLKPGGVLIVSIPNNYCYKYKRKGPHDDHVNNWKFAGFKKDVEKEGFKCLEGYMKGYWLPLPVWLTKTSYQFPLKSRKEFYNTNFFYAFQKQS